jgi:hypothetical protein
MARRRGGVHFFRACMGSGVAAAAVLPPIFQYQPTMQDVDPGIDHGNSDENVPYEFKKQMVFYRRIHATNAPETTGQAVSSGCFRLVNDDVIDLYSRVDVGAKVRPAELIFRRSAAVKIGRLGDRGWRCLGRRPLWRRL